jgi:hypothetical protein
MAVKSVMSVICHCTPHALRSANFLGLKGGCEHNGKSPISPTPLTGAQARPRLEGHADRNPHDAGGEAGGVSKVWSPPSLDRSGPTTFICAAPVHPAREET